MENNPISALNSYAIVTTVVSGTETVVGHLRAMQYDYGPRAMKEGIMDVLDQFQINYAKAFDMGDMPFEVIESSTGSLEVLGLVPGTWCNLYLRRGTTATAKFDLITNALYEGPRKNVNGQSGGPRRNTVTFSGGAYTAGVTGPSVVTTYMSAQSPALT